MTTDAEAGLLARRLATATRIAERFNAVAPACEDGFWQEQGYFAGRRLAGGTWLVIYRMAFTWRVGIADEEQWIDFCCFTELGDAIDCWLVWDGKGLPPGDWTRHYGTGYRHKDGVLYEEDGITKVEQ